MLNLAHFVFGAKEVDGAGIRLTESKVQPLAEHVEAITNFPKPMNITDMMSFWALVS